MNQPPYRNIGFFLYLILRIAQHWHDPIDARPRILNHRGIDVLDATFSFLFHAAGIALSWYQRSTTS
jgi:hypothetical protein